MSDLIVKEGPGFERELPPAEPTVGVCWNVFNVGLQENKLGAPRHRVVIYWEIDVRYTHGDFKGKRMLISQEYTATLAKKGYLRRDLEAWRGKPFNEYELKGFDLSKLRGYACLLNIVHNDGYANVQSIMALPKGTPKFELETDADYIPKRVTNLLAKQIVQENKDTDEIAENGWNQTETQGRPPTDEEVEMF